MLHFRRIMMMSKGLPNGYTPLEYLQTNGSQYLDTGIKPNINTRVVMDAELTDKPPLINATLFGVVPNTLATKSFAFYYAPIPGLFTAEIFSSNINQQRFSLDAYTRLKIDFNKEYVEVNGDKRTIIQDSLDSGQPLTLFCLNSQIGTKLYYATCKFYECKIFDNGALVRDYIPAKSPSGTSGIYDKVNNTFKTL